MIKIESKWSLVDRDWRRRRGGAECDISVTKLLGFKTFPIFWVVSDLVSKKFGIEKSIGFGIEKI